VSPQKIYAHTAPFPRRAFNPGGGKEPTYSQHNHFAPTPVAFGKYHQPGFSTYPAPGRFDDIYEELDKHKQVGWASSEGTNLQLGAGPGQSGMTMETYLAKMFNHGATLVNVYAWGIGGEANKNMSFRLVTEGEEALGAYRKFLKGDPLIEGQITVTLMERLPPKIHKIQEELPAWLPQAPRPGPAHSRRITGNGSPQRLSGQKRARTSGWRAGAIHRPSATLWKRRSNLCSTRASSWRRRRNWIACWIYSSTMEKRPSR
jgi:hypothetical protein